ncbi:hypothetical protein D3C85_212430 [compost metagenome]
MTNPRFNYPPSLWHPSFGWRREWLDAKKRPVSLAELKEHCQTLSTILQRPEADPFAIGLTQAHDLSQKENDTLAFFGITNTLVRSDRDGEQEIRSQQLRIHEWLLDRIWPQPFDPGYQETLESFRAHITDDLRSSPSRLRTWPEIMLESGIALIILNSEGLGHAPLDLQPWKVYPQSPSITPNTKKRHARKALSVSQIKEILRHRLLLGSTRKSTAESLGVSAGSVSHFTTLAKKAGLTWKQIDAFTGAQILAVMRPDLAKRQQPVEPDFNAVHYALQKGETLRQMWKEYRARYKGLRTYGYSYFHALYYLWLPDGHLAKRARSTHAGRHRNG